MTIIVAALLVCSVTVAYKLTKSQAAGSSEESIATIGDKHITRQDWMKKMEDQYGKSTLEDMINAQVVEELAKKNKLTVSNSELEREFLLIKAVNNSFYEDSHITEKEWRDQIRYNILLEELLTKDIDISDKEMQSFYNKNKELYHFDDSYSCRNHRNGTILYFYYKMIAFPYPIYRCPSSAVLQEECCSGSGLSILFR